MLKERYELSIDPIEIPEEDIEDLCEALGFSDYAFELKDDRKKQEEDYA